MLRQVFLFSKNSSEIKYRYQFAKGFNVEELAITIEKIGDFMKNPVVGKIFHRPLMDRQIVYGALTNNIFHLYISDMSDRADYIIDHIKKVDKFLIEGGLDKELEKASTFEELNQDVKTKIDGYLEEIYYDLHPKITLVGPMGGGKSSLFELLSDPNEEARRIMGFALVKKIKVQNIYFDLWDFTLDNFSPLWNNFIRGSDLALIIINGIRLKEENPNYNKIIINFLNLYKREAKFAKGAILLSHISDKHSEEEEIINKFKEQFGDEIELPIYTYNLNKDDPNSAKETIGKVLNIIIEQLDLKRPLPDNFRQLLIESNEMIEKKEYERAIELLNQLINIAEEYQENEYISVFSRKIIELKEKQSEIERLKEEEEEEKELEMRLKRKPEKVVFEEKIKVKSLKSALNTMKNLNPMQRAINSAKTSGSTKVQPLPNAAKSSKRAPKILNSSIYLDKINEEKKLLYNAVVEYGGKISKALLEKFILQLRKRLNKAELSEEDIKKSARLYVEKLKKKIND
ncbi:MAG: hypothetical protein ACTSU2_16305 [Promethearchaeota archaeon]